MRAIVGLVALFGLMWLGLAVLASLIRLSREPGFIVAASLSWVRLALQGLPGTGDGALLLTSATAS
jgi:hypothetical protein